MIQYRAIFKRKSWHGTLACISSLHLHIITLYTEGLCDRLHLHVHTIIIQEILETYYSIEIITIIVIEPV